ncbi:MAG: non-SMC mitotic condensation complex subunit 1 [Planctomycetaceae bacterium]|nr:non-SMC mitotic condensation complex subunit 1 [Planctomycetaceae bacterium]
MKSRSACLLLLLFVTGCGSQLPEEFTVSGKPIEYWLDAQSASQPEARARAIRALGNVDPSIPEVIPAMEKGLTDSDPSIRSQAALALLKFGPAAIDAVPALTQATADRDEQVRNLAAKALQQIQGK